MVLPLYFSETISFQTPRQVEIKESDSHHCALGIIKLSLQLALMSPGTQAPVNQDKDKFCESSVEKQLDKWSREHNGIHRPEVLDGCLWSPLLCFFHLHFHPAPNHSLSLKLDSKMYMCARPAELRPLVNPRKPRTCSRTSFLHVLRQKYVRVYTEWQVAD